MITQINTYPYKKRHLKKPEDLIVREKIYRSPRELDAFLFEIGRQVDEMIEEGYNFEGEAPRRSLRRDCKGCDFQEPCLIGLKGINVEEYLASSGAFRQREARMADDDPMRHNVLSTRLLKATMPEIEIVDEPL